MLAIISNSTGGCLECDRRQLGLAGSVGAAGAAGAAETAEAVDQALSHDPKNATRALAAYGRTQKRRYRFFRRLVLKFYRVGFQDMLFTPEVWPAGTRALASALGGNDRPSLATRLRLEALYLIAWLKDLSLKQA